MISVWMLKSVLRNIFYTLPAHRVLSLFFWICFVVAAAGIVIVGTSVCFINRKASVLLDHLTKPKHNGSIYRTEFHDTHTAKIQRVTAK